MERKAEKENEYAICMQVSALAMDPSGARVITGGYDYEVRLWDFAGMDSSLQSFRTIRPCERQVIRVTSKGLGDGTAPAGLATIRLLKMKIVLMSYVLLTDHPQSSP